MRRLVFLVAALVLVAGCGGDDGGGAAEQAAVGSFVGLLEETDAYVAIISDGENLVGYVSDGKTVSTWFKGDVDGASANLTARTEQELGEVEFLGDTADGEIEIDDEQHSFSAELAVGDAGLYRAAEEDGERTVEVGWVMLNDGSQRGGTNFLEPNADFRTTTPAPVIDPSTDLNVSVNVGGNAIEVSAKPVTPGLVDPVAEFRPR
jgi:hypothetical protein